MESTKRADLVLGLYQHYAGNFYRVMGLCRHSETLEQLVVYQSLYGDYGLWVRLLSLFLETVDVDGQSQPRFKFIKPLFDQPPALR